MKSFFLHKTPEWFQTAASAEEQRRASAKLTKLYSVGSVVVLILYSKSIPYNILHTIQTVESRYYF